MYSLGQKKNATVRQQTIGIKNYLKKLIHDKKCMLYPLTKTFLYKLTPPTAPFKELVWLFKNTFKV